MGLFHSILLGYSLVHELMETVWLEQVQLLIQLAIQTITKPFYFLCIGIHVMSAILTMAIKLLSILIHSVRSLFEGQ
jgi:hypothetical protein